MLEKNNECIWIEKYFDQGAHVDGFLRWRYLVSGLTPSRDD